MMFYMKPRPLTTDPSEYNFCTPCGVGGEAGEDAVCWICENPYTEKRNFLTTSSPDILERTT